MPIDIPFPCSWSTPKTSTRFALCSIKKSATSKYQILNPDTIFPNSGASLAQVVAQLDFKEILIDNRLPRHLDSKRFFIAVRAGVYRSSKSV